MIFFQDSLEGEDPSKRRRLEDGDAPDAEIAVADIVIGLDQPAAPAEAESPMPPPSMSPEPPMPASPFSSIPRSPIVLSPHDCGAKLVVSSSGLDASGEKGYRSCRASHGISVGSLYFEIRLKRSAPMKISGTSTVPHVRVGFASDKADKNAPIGFDRYGYSIRDTDGRVYHEANGADFGSGTGFSTGDVLGCYLVLPPDLVPVSSLNSAAEAEEEEEIPLEEAKKRGGRKKKHAGGASAADAKADEERERKQREEKEREKLAAEEQSGPKMSDQEIQILQRKQQLFSLNSKVQFFLNGVSMGIGFKNLLKGTYYPAVSLYMGAKVEVNFGPVFWNPPAELLEIGGIASLEAATADPSKINIAALSQVGLFPHLPESKITLIQNPNIAAAIAAANPNAAATAANAGPSASSDAIPVSSAAVPAPLVK